MKALISLERIVRKVSAGVNGFGISLLMLMMFATSLDVVLRYLRMPIEGTFEIVTFMQVIFVAFALPYTQAVKGNISTDLVTGHLPPKVRAVISAFTTFLSLVLTSLIAWQTILQGAALRIAGQHSAALELPLYPFYWAFGLGAALLSLVLFVELLLILTGRSGKG